MIEYCRRFILGPLTSDSVRTQQLNDASETLSSEMDKLQKGVQDLALRKKDPIDQIIDNIKKVNGQYTNGVGKQHR